MKSEKNIVIAPDSFVPESSDQDISVMAPLFELYDDEIEAMEEYTEKQRSERQQILKWATEDFYRYGLTHTCDAQGSEWQTLARWRYRNESQYKKFLFFLRMHQKSRADLNQLHANYSDIKAKSDALNRVFSTELYRHHSGATYQLLLIGNTTANKEGYPTSAVYMNIHTREVFVRPYEDFKAKMTAL